MHMTTEEHKGNEEQNLRGIMTLFPITITVRV